MHKSILDMCCGSRMFWFDREDPRVMFVDIRREVCALHDRKPLVVNPDLVVDFRYLPFDSESFNLVVFDPPHLNRAGETGFMRKKYGVLDPRTWREDLQAGFTEAFRVLKPFGTLIFKWNETQIPVKEILALTDAKPAFGHPSGKRANTHWICFHKDSPK